jgi:RNA polymerase sigma-70 factor (ECF subfamily)
MGWLGANRDPGRDEFDSEVLPYIDTLYANALRLTRGRADAEDLVQDTVLRAFRFFDRFERGTNIKAWLLRIQYNTFVNRYRRSTKERDIKESMSLQPVGEDVVSRDALRALTDPVGEALRPLIATELEAALATLPEDHRMVVVLADVEELSYKEIAEVLGCPIGTVMSRLHRARRTLRAKLLDYAQDHGVKDASIEATSTSTPKSKPDPMEEVLPEAVSLSAYRRDRRRG